MLNFKYSYYTNKQQNNKKMYCFYHRIGKYTPKINQVLLSPLKPRPNIKISAESARLERGLTIRTFS